MGWKILKKQGSKIPDNELWSHSWEQKNYCWLLSCWFAHWSAFEVKARARFVPFKPRHSQSSQRNSLCCSQVHVPSWLLCILDGVGSPSRATVLEGHSQSPGCARGQSPTSPPAPWACPAGAALPWTRAQTLCAKLIAAPLSSSPQQFTFCLSPSEWSEPLQPNDVH